jgi:transcriptional regulator with XRE-family HTH domain
VTTIETMKIDGAKLRKLRQQRLLSRQELAEKAGTHRDHIGRLERGDIDEPQMRTIRRLTEALGVSASELLK